jgi:hypothetical protein
MYFKQKMMQFHRKYFILAILLFLIEVIIAKYFHDDFIRPFGGDFLVVILIYCSVRSFFNLPAIAAAIGALLFAYAVELSQYYHLINLLGLEKSTAARLILGTSFSWTDMLMYTLGMILVIIVEVLAGNKLQIAG